MKKVLLMTAILVVFFTSCNLMDVLFDYDNPLLYRGEYEMITSDDIDGTVWQVVKAYDEGEDVIYPGKMYYNQTPDFDNDELPEYTERYKYYYFTNGVIRCYQYRIIHDEGPDTTTFPEYLTDEHPYYLCNEIIHYAHNDGFYNVKNGIVVIKMGGGKHRGYMTGDNLTVMYDIGHMTLSTHDVPSITELENATEYEYSRY